MAAIVNGVETRSRILDAKDGVQEAAAEEIFRASGDTAVLRVVVRGPPASAVNSDLADIVELCGRYVDDAGRAQAILRRQRAGDQAQAADPTGIQELPEGAEPVGEQDAVDAIGNIGVLVAHVQVSACRR